MSEIIDILTPRNDELSTFTVAGAVNFVNVVSFAAGSVMRSANQGFSVFRRGDCFTILSLGYLIPERFAIWSQDEAGFFNSAPLFLLTGLHGGVERPIDTFGNAGILKLPFPNYEFSIGTFNDSEKNLLTDLAGFELKCYFPFIANSLQISMLNVPVSIIGSTFKIVPFIKVLHNFPLTA